MFLNRIGESNTICFSILLILIFSLPLFSQTKSSDGKIISNLNIFYSLVDSAADKAAAEIANGKNVSLNFDSGNSYSVFENQIIKEFSVLGKNIKSLSGGDSSIQINFVIDHAQVNYGKLFQRKLFGDFYTKREISLGGNYAIMQPQARVKNFSFSYIDTVDANNIKDIENPSFGFTQAKLPSEPFFSSIYEPIIAVGAAALTVILFFTVRSK